MLKPSPVVSNAARLVWEHQLPLVRRPIPHLPLKIDLPNVVTKSGEQSRGGLDPPILAVLTRLDPVALLRPRALYVYAATRPVNVRLVEGR